MKTLVIINEPLAEMVLGENTTLAYICACLELGHDVYIHNLPQKGEIFSEKINVIHLNKISDFCKNLVENFKRINREIAAKLSPKTQKVKNVEALFRVEPLALETVEHIIQRTEPMKAPFPPIGAENIEKILLKLKNIFPHLVFNCPIGLNDKQAPQDLNILLKEKIATPTEEFTFDDVMAASAIAAMKSEKQKVVLKPKNSAQSLGVFALEFCADGFGLAEFYEKNIAELKEKQIYQIAPNLEPEELNAIVKILLFVQASKKDSRKLSEISAAEISNTAKNLFNDKIIAQPFLEGVRLGDIRANLIKNSEGNFYLAGCTFRKSLRTENGADFTTCFTAGAAVARPISDLTPAEQKNLSEKITKILTALNSSEMREKYYNCIELGADFILVGDGKNIFLGEINHHCPALLPLSEALGKFSFYDGGLGLAKRAVESALELQKKW